MEYLTNNEIALQNVQDAFFITEILLRNGYACMLSKEEELIIVNYEWSSNDANRNDMVFNSRESFEYEKEKDNRINPYIEKWYNDYQCGLMNEKDFIVNVSNELDELQDIDSTLTGDCNNDN